MIERGTKGQSEHPWVLALAATVTNHIRQESKLSHMAPVRIKHMWMEMSDICVQPEKKPSSNRNLLFISMLFIFSKVEVKIVPVILCSLHNFVQLHVLKKDSYFKKKVT
jgi:hypothetical protein